MATKCSTCGTVYSGWSCPVCSVKEKLEQQKRDLEKTTREQQRTMEESVKEQERILETQREELESAIEESQREMEYALEEAAERQNQIAEETVAKQKKITSESWRLQAESKIEKARELIKAGLNDGAIKLLLEAIHQDPSNLYGYVAGSVAFQNTGQIQKANNFLSKAILLLNTREYKNTLSAYVHLLDNLFLLNMPKDLVQNFKNIFDTNIKGWSFSDERGIIDSSAFVTALELCIDLTALNFLEQANKLSSRLTQRVINYRVIERSRVYHDWETDRSIEHKVALLSMLIHPDLRQFSGKNIFTLLGKDNLTLFMIKGGLLHSALEISKHIIKLL